LRCKSIPGSFKAICTNPPIRISRDTPIKSYRAPSIRLDIVHAAATIGRSSIVLLKTGGATVANDEHVAMLKRRACRDAQEGRGRLERVA
jgi:hypothetical protein